MSKLADMTLAQIEEALDAGRLEANVHSIKWWKLRRNGRTQRWKTRPHAFRIPVKAGIRSTGQITHLNYKEDAMYRVID